jgi:hypothetical protein
MAVIGQSLPNPEAGWKRYQETDKLISYEGATFTSGFGCYYVANMTNAISVKFNFVGDKLRLIGRRSPNRCINNVTIDGILIDTFTQAGPVLVETALDYELLNLPYGEHSVVISGDGTGAYYFNAIDIDVSSALFPYREIAPTGQEAVIVDPNYPNDNFNGQPLRLHSTAILLWRPTIMGSGYLEQLLMKLSLAQLQSAGSVRVGKITQPWDLDTVTYANCPNIATPRTIEFTEASILEFDVSDMYGTHGIALWGNEFLVNIISHLVEWVPTRLLLPEKIHAHKVVSLNWLPILTDEFFRGLVLKRDGVVIFETQDDGIMSFMDETVSPSTNYIYEIEVTLS